MQDRSSPNAPAAMEGRGAYNRSSKVQSEGLLAALPLLEEAARTVALSDAPHSVVIADYGSSQGQNSLAPMRAAIATLRRRVGADRPISVVHADMASNDFSTLFATLENDPDSYLISDPATFATAVGRSFYRQILPPESVTLGWSSWAVQWLSETPAPIPDQVQIAFSADAGAKEAFERRAARDWENFLEARSRELRRGGALVLVTMATTDDGDFGYRAVVAAIYGGLLDLVREGFLSGEELARMAIPTVARQRADFLAPFAATGDFRGLAVARLDIFEGADWIWGAYEQERDPATFGRRWAAFNRASVFPTMAIGLNAGSDERRRAEFFDRLEHAVARKLAAKPEPTTIPLARMTIVKTSGEGSDVSPS
jgi:hypothetical protein